MERIDPTFNLPIMSVEVFGNLLVLPPDTVVTTTKKYVLNEVSFYVYNGRFIKPYVKEAINMTLGSYNEEVYNVLETAQVDPLYLPKKWCNLVRLTQNVLSDPNEEELKYYETPVSREYLATLIGYFTIYPEFGPVYEEYLENPDESVVLENVNPTLHDQHIKIGSTSSNDVRMTCHLSNGKNSPTIPIKEYITKYLENRAKAVRFTLDDEKAKWLICPDGLEKMGALWNQVPKLKEMVFNFLFRVRGKKGELSAAVMLLAGSPSLATILADLLGTGMVTESSMVTIKCIMSFIDADQKTWAHLERQIWREIREFLNTAKTIKTDMGAMWPYFRIIRPKDTSLSAQKFPNLARAAVIYYKTFVDTSETFSRVVLPTGATLADLDFNAKKRLDNSFLLQPESENMESLDQDEKEVAERLGLDVTKWIAPRTLRRQLDMDGDGNGRENLVSRMLEVLNIRQ